MFKLFAGFGFVFVIMTALSFMFESGSSGFVVSQLDAAIDSDDTIIPVDTATGFIDPPGTSRRIMYIEKEAVTYTGVELTVDANCAPFDAPCFTGIVRGQLDSDANGHSDESFVYNEPAGALNSLGAYNIGRQEENVGEIEGVIFTPLGLKNAAVQLVRFDSAYFGGNLAFIRLALIGTLALGFVAAMVALFVGTIRGLFGG